MSAAGKPTLRPSHDLMSSGIDPGAGTTAARRRRGLTGATRLEWFAFGFLVVLIVAAALADGSTA